MEVDTSFPKNPTNIPDRKRFPVYSPNGFGLTLCRDAIERLVSYRWERYDEFDPERVILRNLWPPIYEMESLDQLPPELLAECSIFSLSKNMIENIRGLTNFKQLKVLSLAQNQIKSLSGLEVVSGTLEELIIAWNMISKVDTLLKMSKLKTLDISYNHIKDFTEYCQLKYCPALDNLTFKGNPLCGEYPDVVWKDMALRMLPFLRSFDGELTTNEGESLTRL